MTSGGAVPSRRPEPWTRGPCPNAIGSKIPRRGTEEAATSQDDDFILDAVTKMSMESFLTGPYMHVVMQT